jgi:hypothetical protein
MRPKVSGLVEESKVETFDTRKSSKEKKERNLRRRRKTR